jgi:FAD/FMN-containing dehydrogenase
MMKSRRRWAWASGLIGACVVITLGRPSLHLTLATLRDRQDRPLAARGSIDDASGLDETRVAEVWNIPADSVSAEKQLVALVQRGRAEGLAISIAGARHSMGGHSIRRDGIVINMLPFHGMQLDEARNILRVQAGARWSEIIPLLNARGRSVAVMQSNNSFSVGGSLSVNCHGWQAKRPPIASTVESFRILRADGSIVRCSREENAELFSLALGGYGLFGVVLDADLRVVPNEKYRLERFVIPGNQYVSTFERHVSHTSDVGMAYGRLSVAPESFLREAILNVFHRVPSGTGKPSPINFPEISGLTRAMFRGQVASDYGKSLRWEAEKRFEGVLSSRPVYRNQLLNEAVDVFANRSAESTDILHEYFVPPESFDALVVQLQLIITKHKGDLLNVTVRDVLRDDDTVLRYADRDMFALVLLFNQPRTAEGDASMEAMTRELIDAAVRLGGRYYLPYRLHATSEQLRNAYPQVSRFLELKRHYDPQETFQNSFYLKYVVTEGPARPLK